MQLPMACRENRGSIKASGLLVGDCFGDFCRGPARSCPENPILLLGFTVGYRHQEIVKIKVSDALMRNYMNSGYIIM